MPKIFRKLKVASTELSVYFPVSVFVLVLKDGTIPCGKLFFVSAHLLNDATQVISTIPNLLGLWCRRVMHQHSTVANPIDMIASTSML